MYENNHSTNDPEIMSRLLPLLVLAIIFATPFVCEAQEPIETTLKLQIVTNIDRPPYTWTNPCTKQPSGVIYRFTKLAAKRTGWNIEYSKYQFGSDIVKKYIHDIRIGKLDGFVVPSNNVPSLLHIGKQPITKIHGGVIYFSNSLPISSWSDMKGKTGVHIDFHGTSKFNKKFSRYAENNLTLITTKTFNQALNTIRKSEADFIISDYNVISGLIRMIDSRSFYRVKKLDENVFNDLYLGLSREKYSISHLDALDESIKFIRDSGQEKLLMTSSMTSWLNSKDCESKK